MSFNIVVNLPSFIKTCLKYNINTPLRMAHFFSQLAHESGNFTKIQENLNYSASGLLSVFGKYFNTTTAKQYERQPQRIANRVYANRNGNGNEASGDGWRYRGRGYIQLTGKGNYIAYQNASGYNVVANPDLLLDRNIALDCAGWYWSMRNLNIYADNDNVLSISKIINQGNVSAKGEPNGLADRIAKLKYFKNIDLVSLLSPKKKWWHIVR